MGAAEQFAERLAALDEEAERAVLDTILAAGFEQGCFLRLAREELIPLDVASLEHIFNAVRDRPRVRASGDDPHPDGLGDSVIAGAEPGFVVLTQRCDLMSGFHLEPFAEVALAYSLAADSDAARSARLNSARLIQLCEHDGQLWVADLRVRALIAKDVLAGKDAVNVVPRVRRPRFRLRLGQRYTRDALPNRVVESIQRPLIDKVVGRNATTRDLAAVFTDWLLSADGNERYRLLAVIDHDRTQADGDDAYQELSELFPQELDEQLTDKSGAITMEQLDFLMWLTALKINLDEISWHPTKGEGQSEPTR